MWPQPGGEKHKLAFDYYVHDAKIRSTTYDDTYDDTCATYNESI